MKYTIRDEKVIADAWLDMHVSQNMLKNKQLHVYVCLCCFIVVYLMWSSHFTNTFYYFPFYNRKVSQVLVKSSLWGCFDPIAKECIYLATLACIKKAYSELIGSAVTDVTENPIVCVFLLVTCNEDNLQITESFVEGSRIIETTTPVHI